MRKNLLFLMALVMVKSGLSQWQLLFPLPQTNDLNSVRFVSSTMGFAVGNFGTIIKTLDAGSTWSVLSSGTSKNLNSVFFLDVHTGFVVGDSGLILKTVNSGMSWNLVPSGTVKNLNSICFSPANGFIVGDSAVILKTVDAGNSWNSANASLVSQNYKRNIYSVFCYSSSEIYACGDTRGAADSPIFISGNGGTGWGGGSAELNGTMYSIVVMTKRKGFCAGTSALRIASSPNITFWNYGNKVSQHIERCLFFTDSLTGYSVGDNGMIAYTTDATTSWMIQNSTVSDNLNSVYFTDRDHGVAVGQNGVILKTVNGGVGLKDNQAQLKDLQIFPNPTTGNITVDTKGHFNQLSLHVFDVYGKEVYVNRNMDQITILNLSCISKGIYFLSIESEAGRTVKKIIVE
jgi:photosystem II stability/assembly factor-like uncharacterized protein